VRKLLLVSLIILILLFSVFIVQARMGTSLNLDLGMELGVTNSTASPEDTILWDASGDMMLWDASGDEVLWEAL